MIENSKLGKNIMDDTSREKKGDVFSTTKKLVSFLKMSRVNFGVFGAVGLSLVLFKPGGFLWSSVAAPLDERYYSGRFQSFGESEGSEFFCQTFP
jgi:hypothetical protein